MKNLKLFLFLLVAVCISCSKEEPVMLKIVDAKYRVEKINDPECGDAVNGSSIQVTLEIANIDIIVEKLVNQYVDEEGRGGKLDEAVNATAAQSGKLSFQWCYLFNESNWFDEKYKLVGMTMNGAPIESNEFTLRINRPDGAN